MIELNWEGMSGQIGELMKAYGKLPRHIAKKHLQAAMKRAMKDAVPVLKSNTPKGGTRTIKSTIVRGEQKTNYKRRGGALRRAATVVARYKGRNADGVVFGVMGYKFGTESRKAIWLENGTKTIAPRGMVARSMRQYRGPAISRLTREMAAALEKAARDLAPGVDQGYRRK